MQFLKPALLIASLAAAGQQAQAAGPVRTAKPIPAGTVQTGSQWITTPDGCSYSRTQAPGYAAQWILILNPHHIGRPNAHMKCAPVLGG